MASPLLGKYTHQALEMLHEHLETDIVSEDSLTIPGGRVAVETGRHVRC